MKNWEDEERREEKETEEWRDSWHRKRQEDFIWGGTVGFSGTGLNVDQYTKAAAAIQNAIQCYLVIYDKKKRAATQTSLDHFFKTADRIESSKEPELVPSTSCVNEIAACPPFHFLLLLMVLQLCYLLSLVQSVTFCLFTWCQPMYAPVYMYCTTILFKILYCKIKTVLFFVF